MAQRRRQQRPILFRVYDWIVYGIVFGLFLLTVRTLEHVVRSIEKLLGVRKNKR